MGWTFNVIPRLDFSDVVPINHFSFSCPRTVFDFLKFFLRRISEGLVINYLGGVALGATDSDAVSIVVQWHYQLTLNSSFSALIALDHFQFILRKALIWIKKSVSELENWNISNILLSFRSKKCLTLSNFSRVQEENVLKMESFNCFKKSWTTISWKWSQ